MSRDLKQKLQTGEIELPPIPRAQQEIVDLLQDPNCGMREIGMAIAQDLAFTTKVLRVANSVLYSAGEPILSVPRAAIVMGIEALQEVLQELSELELVCMNLQKCVFIQLARLLSLQVATVMARDMKQLSHKLCRNNLVFQLRILKLIMEIQEMFNLAWEHMVHDPSQ